MNSALLSEKTYAQRAHAKTRVEERFGITINRKDYADMVQLIASGKARFLGRQSNRVSVFRLVFKDVPMKVVYDSKRGNVVTVLPEDEWIECSR